MDTTVGDGYKLSASELIRAYLQLTKLRIVALLCFTTISAMFVAEDVGLIGGFYSLPPLPGFSLRVGRVRSTNMLTVTWTQR